MIPSPALIVAAHPDDEVLGAGGFTARHPGTMIAVVSEGTSREAGDVGARLAAKRRATLEAALLLGGRVVAEGDFEDQRLQLVPELVGWIERVVRESGPVSILTHSPRDLNQDHRVVAEAVAVAARPYSAAGAGVKMLLGFHVDPRPAPWAEASAPRLFLRLTEDDLRRKLAALGCYAEAGAMRDWPHPRSLEAVRHHAHWLGSTIGAPAAEAYDLVWGEIG